MRKPAQTTTERLAYKSAGAETPQAKRARERREAADARDMASQAEWEARNRHLIDEMLDSRALLPPVTLR